MEKSNTQPHGLTNIELPSQLPFIPPKENSIRLFGKDFCGNDPTIVIANDTSSPLTTTTIIHHETKENQETQRVFGCHYCSRNFPTSQALGGHQNAHRRERLRAKGTHIQSITTHHNSSESQLHAYPNHHNGRLPTTASPAYHHHTINPYNNCVKFYGHKASYSSSIQTPLYGRPLVASRVPKAVQKLTTFNRGRLMNYSHTGSSTRRLYMHESKPRFNDQVSLDLHL